MSSKPFYREIDHRTMKLIVGLMAIFLAPLTNLLSEDSLESISASYHAGGLARDVFVGFLFAISTFMVAYNGRNGREQLLGRIAAGAGMGVAVFPCHCGNPDNEIIPWVHGISAAVMFVVLAFFCLGFYRAARKKPHKQAQLRAQVYRLCLIVIVIVIAALGLDAITGGHLKESFESLTFWGEYLGLVAFGISWLTASLAIPLITSQKELVDYWRGNRHDTPH